MSATKSIHKTSHKNNYFNYENLRVISMCIHTLLCAANTLQKMGLGLIMWTLYLDNVFKFHLHLKEMIL